MKNVMTKHVQENPPNFRDMAIAMLEGISCIDISVDVESTLAFYYNLHKLKCKFKTQKISTYFEQTIFQMNYKKIHTNYYYIYTKYTFLIIHFL